MDRRWQVTQDGDGAMTVHAARLLEVLAARLACPRAAGVATVDTRAPATPTPQARVVWLAGSCLAGALLGAALNLCRAPL